LIEIKDLLQVLWSTTHQLDDLNQPQQAESKQRVSDAGNCSHVWQRLVELGPIFLLRAFMS
jgi:hypothetical protein